jgi:hypothetical protein
MSRATVRCESSSPSLGNSPWMRGAPQRGLASAMVRTSWAISELTDGRPVRPRRDLQVQKARKPCRCQRITVSGRTNWGPSRHPSQWLESHIQKTRSRRRNCGRFDRRRSRTSCCRSARFSSVRSVRLLSAARRAPKRASTRAIGVHGSHAARPTSSLRDWVLAKDSTSNAIIVTPQGDDGRARQGPGLSAPAMRISVCGRWSCPRSRKGRCADQAGSAVPGAGSESGPRVVHPI